MTLGNVLKASTIDPSRYCLRIKSNVTCVNFTHVNWLVKSNDILRTHPPSTKLESHLEHSSPTPKCGRCPQVAWSRLSASTQTVQVPPSTYVQAEHRRGFDASYGSKPLSSHCLSDRLEFRSWSRSLKQNFMEKMNKKESVKINSTNHRILRLPVSWKKSQ